MHLLHAQERFQPFPDLWSRPLGLHGAWGVSQAPAELSAPQGAQSAGRWGALTLCSTVDHFLGAPICKKAISPACWGVPFLTRGF